MEELELFQKFETCKVKTTTGVVAENRESLNGVHNLVKERDLIDRSAKSYMHLLLYVYKMMMLLSKGTPTLPHISDISGRKSFFDNFSF